MANKRQTLITDHFKTSEGSEPVKFPESVKSSGPVKSSGEPAKSSDTVELVYGYKETTNSWHCLECGDDMGPTNPRQLCGKYFCRSKW